MTVTLHWVLGNLTVQLGGLEERECIAVQYACGENKKRWPNQKKNSLFSPVADLQFTEMAVVGQ